MNRLPALRGITWLAQGFALMRAQPGRLLLLAVLLQLVLWLARVPLVGFFVILAMPALSAGLLQAFRMIAAGQRPASTVLFAPLAAGPKTGRLLMLGALMVVVSIVAVSLLLSGSDSMLDPELLARIEQGDAQALAELDPELVLRMFTAIVVGISLSGTLSFMAIPLLWFRDWKLGAALTSGIRALFVNWRPFTVLGLGLAALLVPVALAVAMFFPAAGTGGGFSLLLLGLIVLVALAFQLLVFATQYCSFRDIYGLDAPLAGAGSGADDQLLA